MESNDTNDRTDAALERAAGPGEERVRRPYEAPRVESGVAFEKVLLLSGCNSGFFCPIPC